MKDFDNGQGQTIELVLKDADERKMEEIRMINDTHKMVYLQIKQEERRRTEILGSNLWVAYSIIFANFCDRELQINWSIEMILSQKLRIIPLNCWLLSRK